MFEKPKVVLTPSFNYILLIIGILAFIFFNFILDANLLISLIISLCPITVGIINLNKIKNNK
ncbi:hypothetical protein BUZ46_09545 [Staphylococcus hominis]|nr:hypothetical protein BUZ45_07990 [Staphylococcus hominis]PTK36625.1 hypothetical protein BUZ46_09545 [Staphylococcus hominis]PTK42433.1 hypothetical protein BUZ48_11220 [Staphylococcus hominis]RIO50845.1 hypothetical protein BUZ55_01540 [Staphylococcus hominis]